MKYSMFFYKRSLARASSEDLRLAAEAVVDAAIICNASRGRVLAVDFESTPELAEDSCGSPDSDGQCCSSAGCSSGGSITSGLSRERLIKALLENPIRTAELFSR